MKSIFFTLCFLYPAVAFTPLKPRRMKFRRAAAEGEKSQGEVQLGDIDEETSREYNAAISAEFDRTMQAMSDIGEELKRSNDEEYEELKAKSLKEKIKMFEEQQAEVVAYEDTVSALAERVRAESANVEREVATLSKFQDQLQNDPLLRLSNLREQPIHRQALLASSVLFFVRGGADAISAVGDPGPLLNPCIRYGNPTSSSPCLPV